MNPLHLLQSQYYPYHLTWEELNNPGLVIQQFLQNWDLPECRIKLREYQKLAGVGECKPSELEHAEIKSFLEEVERLVEAVYIMRLEFEARNSAS